MMQWEIDTAWYLVPLLLLFFVVYQVVDRRVNTPSTEQDPTSEIVGNLPLGLLLAVGASIAISIAGYFLGTSTAVVVKQMEIPPAVAGWILGFVTSIPEMVTFFAVYSTAKKESTIDGKSDTQECLDNLAGSNMSNVGVVYPLGLLAYLIGSRLLGSCSQRLKGRGHGKDPETHPCKVDFLPILCTLSIHMEWRIDLIEAGVVPRLSLG